jgi:hypothetical protein
VKMGGARGSEACFAWLASRLAQGQVGRGAAALALLALLGCACQHLRGVGGSALARGINGNVGALAAMSGCWDVVEAGR